MSNPTDDLVLCEIDSGVATLTLNRPERKNGWTYPMEHRFFALLDEVIEDPDVRAIVLTGASGNFCPGLDMSVLSEISTGDGLDRTGRRPIDTLLRGPKPVIGAIEGLCAGLGFLFATMCDVRFVSRTARLSTAFVRRGLTAEYTAAWILPKLVGQEIALDLLLSGRLIDGAEAHRLGLASRLCEPGDVLDEAVAYARELATNCSPFGMAAIRHQVRGYAELTAAEAMEHSLALMEYSNKAVDFTEGVASFVEKRKPNFAPWTPMPAGVDPLGLVP